MKKKTAKKVDFWDLNLSAMAKKKFQPTDRNPCMTVNIELVTASDESQVVLFKRAANKDKYPGRWSLPGGGVNDNEKPVQAAKRELLEETGLRVSKKDLTPTNVTENSEGKIHVYFRCSVKKKALKDIVLNEEHETFYAFGYDDIPDDKDMHPRIARQLSTHALIVKTV